MVLATVIYLVIGVLVWGFLAVYLDALNEPQGVLLDIAASVIVVVFWPAFAVVNMAIYFKAKHRRNGR